MTVDVVADFESTFDHLASGGATSLPPRIPAPTAPTPGSGVPVAAAGAAQSGSAPPAVTRRPSAVTYALLTIVCAVAVGLLAWYVRRRVLEYTARRAAANAARVHDAIADQDMSVFLPDVGGDEEDAGASHPSVAHFGDVPAVSTSPTYNNRNAGGARGTQLPRKCYPPAVAELDARLNLPTAPAPSCVVTDADEPPASAVTSVSAPVTPTSGIRLSADEPFVDLEVGSEERNEAA